MEAIIIADDLTGANDTGVQLARRGLSTSVLFKLDDQAVVGQDAIVLNTDSRSCSKVEAYERVAEAAQFLKPLFAKLIYKKIDSMLRGNIGAELDAMYDVFSPDLIIVAPAYPDTGRTTVDGMHYLNGIPVHETDVGADQKTPVTESYIPSLLAQQTQKRVALITYKELRAGEDALVNKIHEIHAQDIPYIVSDAETEADLHALVLAVTHSGYRVVWAGSAGLAKCLPISMDKCAAGEHAQETIKPNQTDIARSSHPLPVMVAVGSMSIRSCTQLQMLLTSQNVVGVELCSEQLITGPAEREREIQRACKLGLAAVHMTKDVVIYVSTGIWEATRTFDDGQSQTKDAVKVSNSIAEAIGETVSNLLQAGDWAGLVMTGGDTAARICDQLGMERLELIDEVESGVPIGLLRGGFELHAITKAGSFGSDKVLLKSVSLLKGLLDTDRLSISHKRMLPK